MFNWLLRMFQREKHQYRGTFIAPSGPAPRNEPCHVCGRLPELWEDDFMIYGKPLCEYCFEEHGVAGDNYLALLRGEHINHV